MLCCACRQSITNLQTRFMLLLTGTPIQNNMSELFSIMNLVDENKFPELDDFLTRFGDPVPTPDQLKDLQVTPCSHPVLRPSVAYILISCTHRSVSGSLGMFTVLQQP